MSIKKFYITTPIYYASDKPHIGHAYTTVAADVLARYHKLSLGEENIFFLTGTDEHGSKVAGYALKNNKEPQDYVDEIAEGYKVLWKKLGIKYNYFIRTTDKNHINAVERFLEILKQARTPKNNEAIYEGEYSGLYCSGCEGFKKDSDLENELCPDHKTKPEFLKEKNWFFKLSDYVDVLKDLIENDKLKIDPETRKNEVLGFLNQGLEDIAISRPNIKWGILLPFDKDQTTYVWVDALINYISALGYPDKFLSVSGVKWWPADLHLVGKDILKFHAVIWPALLMAVELATPKRIFAHGYFTVDGQKMSKTIGNIVDPAKVSEKYGVDALRYFVLAEIPFGEDGDFSFNRLSERYNADLVNGLGNLISRVLTLTEKKHENRVPARSENNSDKSVQLNRETWEKYRALIQELELHKMLENIWAWIRCCDKYIDKEKPWKDEKPDVIYNLLESIRHIAWMTRPFMPETSDKIFEQLYADEKDKKEELKKTLDQAIGWGGLKPGTRVEKKEILFPRITN